MFGESDDEGVSRNSRSPWEALSSDASPSPSSYQSSMSDIGLEVKKALDQEFPRLVPEIEEGNVEYKLKLCSPTPERFTKLVTQMKWRLLAGGGQALYEIGVSDSGQLVGLSRKDLDDSLETLERMAGELGATVIVQKEVTLPFPCAPIDRKRVSGALRVVPLSVDDYTASSSTDMDGSSSDYDYSHLNQTLTPSSFIDSGVDLLQSSVARSSPKPIIRNYPYGQAPRIRTPSESLQDTTSTASPMLLPSSLQDDDAAFGFDLDINSFSKYAPTRPLPQTQVTRPTKSQSSNKPKRVHRTVDPIAKAAKRRQRREERRLGLEPGVNHPTIGETSTSTMITLTVQVHDPVEERQGARDDGDMTPPLFDPLAPRFIVEALVLRKLTTEEAFLDLEGLQL